MLAVLRNAGLAVIIAGAGMAAHLWQGVMASYTILPVIGVPLSGGALGGFDALCSTVMMPTGVPVATVAIDGAANAALLAAPDPGVERWRAQAAPVGSEGEPGGTSQKCR